MSDVEPTGGTRVESAPGSAPGERGDGPDATVADAVVDLLVEEVSIDGMCGVY